MTTHFKKTFFCLVLATLLVMGDNGICHAGLAKDQLQTAIEQILSVLREPALKGEDQKSVRREKLRQIAASRFDYRMMSEKSLGKHWNDRTDKEKDEFTRLFSKLLEDTYMAKIEAYTDEKVVFLNERIVKDKAQVNTKIITDTVEIPINYRMYKKSDTEWVVYDLVIEGVSLNSNYRSQFGQILDSHSFEELVAQLKAK